MIASVILILVLFAMTAAFIQRTTGFGFGIFIMTILPTIMPSYGEATALSGLLAAITSLTITIQYWRLILWRRLLPILLTFMLVSYFSVGLVSSLRSDTLKAILGITLILASLYFWFCAGRIRLRPTLTVQASLGTLSGMMGGLFGMQGPPAAIYFLEVTKQKKQYTAMIQTYFLLGNIMMTLFRANQGFLTHEVFISWCWGLPAVLTGTMLGSWFANRISMPVLKKIVYIYIGISGFLALLT